MKKEVVILFAVFLIASIHAFQYSNESIRAREELNKSYHYILDMKAENIPTKRVSELYEEANQIYEGQLALETKNKKADYSIVFEKTKEIERLWKISLKAKDELAVFNETYIEASKSTNLSAIEKDYLEIIKSFEDERFEDTLKLIEKGYEKISEIQASQTKLRLFYETTSRSLKEFLKKNWWKILLGLIGIGIFFMIFGKQIHKFMLKRKLKNLEIKKKTIEKLIREIQDKYFNKKTISETEYYVKLKKFSDMIRDLEREIPLIREELVKIKDKERK